jgi:hypothetical protein
MDEAFRHIFIGLGHSKKTSKTENAASNLRPLGRKVC